ncbi:MAG: Gfo/Idh/MocA family oxidoreductase [Gammaproteobacteria bacterium]|nr:Gfo/Idh/MocA family oxidoreductase [Gammaproteobacteria bacterium]|tara:strand:- start:14527 stop:15450 length:924 start_codon:yes stop_codon:yes gene_type:complete
MKRKKLNIGVVGIGYLGKYHLEKFISNKQCDTKWVVDTNLDNIDLNGHDSIQKSSNYKEILNDIDAISLVTPTKMHFKIAKFFLENKKHVLIEKPMTETVAQAKKLVDLAKKNKVILQVGHLERFNPVMKRLTKEISDPLFIEVHRLAKFNPRSTDVNVIFDLMIHDIDIVTTLMKKNIKNVSAFGKKIITTSTDIANVRLEFSGGSVANLTASRISQKNERKIRVFEKDKYYSVDFMNSNIKKYIKNSKASKELFSFKEFKYDKTDALKDEINNFILSCLGKEKPLVDGKQGKAAVETATLISKLL